MRIGIDARMMGAGYGIGRYIEQLVSHLFVCDADNDYVIFVKDAAIDVPDTWEKIVVDIPWYSIKEQTHFTSVIKKAKVDVMHFPHWNVPFLYQDPFVVTIHDLTMFHFSRPEATTLGPVVYALKDFAHRMIVRRVVKKAKHIITTSDFTKQDIAKTLSVSEKKMSTIYQAPFEMHSASFIDILKDHRISKPYVLYVGAAYPHKNTEMLLHAWSIFKKEHDTEDVYQLILAGKENFFYNRLVEKINDPSIIYTGFVSDESLDSLYAQADLFVFPSLYEGFGLPPLEAMQRDVPVVSSNASCMPEILGDSVLYADPKDPAFFAGQIARGLFDEDVRFELKKKGKKRSSEFSWEKLAEETLRVYQQA